MLNNVVNNCVNNTPVWFKKFKEDYEEEGRYYTTASLRHRARPRFQEDEYGQKLRGQNGGLLKSRMDDSTAAGTTDTNSTESLRRQHTYFTPL